MRIRIVLAIILLGVVLCFVPGAGYGKLFLWPFEEGKASSMDFIFLQARLNYMMGRPDTFLFVTFLYDGSGVIREVWGLPPDVQTKGKICVTVTDNRGIFSNKSGPSLLKEFEKQLNRIYVAIWLYASDMDSDITAIFYLPWEIRGTVPLGYFYEGEYHLVEE